MAVCLLNRPIANAVPDWLSWDFWAKDSQSLNHLALIIAGVIGIPLLAIRTFAANRSARAALEQAKAANQSAAAAFEQAKTAAERHDEQTKADRERRITESMAKAGEQLGSDKLETRLVGIYTLERIARESAREYWPIMETLTAFVRERAPWPPRGERVPWPPRQALANAAPAAKDAIEKPRTTRPATDIQAALTVLGRRDETARKLDPAAGRWLDLRNTDMRGANLSGAHLEVAVFIGAHLEVAVLAEAHLEGAYLSWAHLEGATLSWAHLEGAVLAEAHLEGANLSWAHLEGANLREAHLEGANLAGARSLTQEKLNSAYGDANTTLPDGLTRPPHWPAATPDEPDTTPSSRHNS